MQVLVTGGAGYIGSFMTKKLLERGYGVIVFDNLERGYRDAVDERAKFVRGDLRDFASIEDVFCRETIDAVMHFAGYISVEESEKCPSMYYENNVIGSKNLFWAAINLGKVDTFVFSSSAAVYGNPITIPIPETHARNPTNPYGKTKLAIEAMLEDFSKKEGMSFVSLRYFNASGAALDGRLGEKHNPETHIIPLAISAALQGKEFSLYGTDYATPDGTCIRDYIHVIDLVEAHVLTLERLAKERGGFFYNVGTGKGHSNREVLEMVKRVSGVDLKIKEAHRRQGDAEVLVADATEIKKEIGFEPKYSELETIVRSAWQWHKKTLHKT